MTLMALMTITLWPSMTYRIQMNLNWWTWFLSLSSQSFLCLLHQWGFCEFTGFDEDQTCAEPRQVQVRGGTKIQTWCTKHLQNQQSKNHGCMMSQGCRKVVTRCRQAVLKFCFIKFHVRRLSLHGPPDKISTSLWGSGLSLCHPELGMS